MTRLELITDLNRIRQNAFEIKKRVPKDAGIIWVVKADAYGHGAVQVAKTLSSAALAGKNLPGGFAVATADEARTLSRAETGVDPEQILLLGPACGDVQKDDRFTRSVGSRHDVKSLLSDLAPGQSMNVHIKIDTGMSRLGARGTAELSQLLDALDAAKGRLHVTGMFSHLCAADEDENFTAQQKQSFDEARSLVLSCGFKPLCHLAASTAMLRSDYAYDCVRAGIALYGTGLDALKDIVHPAQSLKTFPIAFHRLEAGDTVGYSRRFTAQRPSLIMTVPCGYGDGYPRILSGRADVLVKGRRAPIVGNVCMDMLMADVTDIPDIGYETPVYLLGRDGDEEITPDELAQKAQTIPYEIMLGFSGRVTRSWTGLKEK